MQETNLMLAVIVWVAAMASMFAMDLLASQFAMFEGFLPQLSDVEPINAKALHKHEPIWLLEEQLLSYKYADARKQFTLRTSVGNLYREQGFYNHAFMHYKEAHRLATKLDSDECHVMSLHLLGLTCFQQGKLQAAQQFLEQALLFESVPQTPRVKILHALANVQRERGHFDVSLNLYQQAREAGTSQSLLDTDYLPLLMADMAEAHIRCGALGTAHEYLQQALDQQLQNIEIIDDHVSGPKGTYALDLAVIRNVFGSMYHIRGDVTRAMEFYRSAQRIQARHLRPDHPELVATRIGIARAQRDLGYKQVALKTTDSMELVLRQGPQEGPDLSRILILKAEMLHEDQRFADAERAIKEALKLQSIWYADDGDHPEVVFAFGAYGSLLHAWGKIEAAFEYYNHALDVSMRSMGSAHPETAAIHNRLGALYEDIGDTTSASEQFTMCLTIQLSTVGERSLDVGTTYNNLATVFFRQGMAKDAARYLRKALHVLDLAGVPKSNPERAIYSENLSEVLSFCKSKGLEEQVCQDDR